MDEKMVDRQKFYTLFSQGKMEEVKKLTQDLFTFSFLEQY